MTLERSGMAAPLGDNRLKELATADWAEIEELNQIASELLWFRNNRESAATSYVKGVELPAEWESLKAAALKATPGPWRECGHDKGGCVCRQVWSIPADGIVAIAQRHEDTDGEGFMQEQAVHNAVFIAAASPDVILKLLAQLSGVEPEPTFWVIERFEEGLSKGYWFGNSSRDFRPEIDKAIQFCRKEDASRIRLSWHWNDCLVTEHKYLSGVELTSANRLKDEK